MEVQVRYRSTSFAVQLPCDATVQDLRKIIATSVEISEAQQRLIFQGVPGNLPESSPLAAIPKKDGAIHVLVIGSGARTVRDAVERRGADRYTLVTKTIDGSPYSCTYGFGYCLQPVYCCLTCHRRNAVQPILCLGCALTCHGSHDVEQRGFRWSARCDCVTSASPHPCQLVVDATTLESLQDGLPPNRRNDPLPSTICYCGIPNVSQDISGVTRRMMIESESGYVLDATTDTDGGDSSESSADDDECDAEGEPASATEVSETDGTDFGDVHQRRRVQGGASFRVCQLCHFVVCKAHVVKLDLSLRIKFAVCSNSWNGGRYRVDRIAIHCETCNKVCCWCCALHCHDGHTLGQPRLDEYAHCGCDPCQRHDVDSSMESQQCVVPEVSSALERLLSNYPTDKNFDPFVCGFCVDKHRKWLLEKPISTCYRGEFPTTLMSQQLAKECKINRTPGGRDCCQGLVLPEDFLALYTCSCNLCRSSLDAMFPGFQSDRIDLRSFERSPHRAVMCCLCCSAPQHHLDTSSLRGCTECSTANAEAVPIVVCEDCVVNNRFPHEHQLSPMSGDQLRMILVRHMAATGLLGDELRRLICEPWEQVRPAFDVMVEQLRKMESARFPSSGGELHEKCPPDVNADADDSPLLKVSRIEK